MNALVSIAIATYNGEKYIKKQLDSILNQSYSNLEIIICDDCSTDNTVKIIKSYNDKRIALLQNATNLGYVKNFEKAIGLCSGDFIALADQDDIWEKEKINVLLENIGDYSLIHSDCSLIDETDKILADSWKGEIFSHNNYNDFLYSNVVTGCSSMFSKKMLNNILPFPDGLGYHDWYLAILAAKEHKIKYIHKTLIQYRQHAGQDTGAIDPNKYLSLILDPLKRLLNIKTRRNIGISKHLQNLYALKRSNLMISRQEAKELDEAIVYFEDYLKHYVHLKMFLIGCKYRKHKYRYGKHNYFCIPNLMRELLG